MASTDGRGDLAPVQRTYGDAEAAVDLATYESLKRSVAIWAGIVAGVAAVILLPWSPAAAVAVAIGGGCGVGNMFLSMRGNERLVDTGRVRAFVLSSFLRLGLFGIVAAALVLREPWWSLGPFFAGFFLPLALYAAAAPRAFNRK
jgi:hypothetical protein